MRPLWESCPDTAYLNSSSAQDKVQPCRAEVSSVSTQGRSCCPCQPQQETPHHTLPSNNRHPRSRYQSDKKSRHNSRVAATQSSPSQGAEKDKNNCRIDPRASVRFVTVPENSPRANEERHEPQKRYKQERQGAVVQNWRTESTRDEPRARDNGRLSTRVEKLYRRKRRIEVVNPLAVNVELMNQHPGSYEHPYSTNRNRRGQDVHKTGDRSQRRSARRAEDSTRAAAEFVPAHQDGNSSGSRRRQRGRRQDRNTGSVAMERPEVRVRVADKSRNKREKLEGDPSDTSNNRWFHLFGKQEDPRQTEERFYGGLETPRLVRSLEHHPWDRRTRTFQSPGSRGAFPPAPVRTTPTDHQTQHATSEEGINAELQHEASQNTLTDDAILGVSTNDPAIGRHLMALGALPYGSFKTVSVLLESPKQTKRAAAGLPVYLTAHDLPPLATRLQPYVPFDSAQPRVASPSKVGRGGPSKPEQTGGVGAATSGVDEEAVRLPPVQFKPNVEKDVTGPLSEPFHHPGIAWPLAFATQPPYVTPGHESAGVKQPVGVLQTGQVPARPLRSRAWGLDTDIPAWLSPLYKTYGIGGPYGRHGPFAEPCLLAQDGRWDTILRQAEGLGALNIPGVITDSGRLDLTGLCGDYMVAKREEQKALERRKSWNWGPYNAFRGFFNQVKVKLKLGTRKEGGERKSREGDGESKVNGPGIGQGQGSRGSQAIGRDSWSTGSALAGLVGIGGADAWAGESVGAGESAGVRVSVGGVGASARSGESGGGVGVNARSRESVGGVGVNARSRDSVDVGASAKASGGARASAWGLAGGEGLRAEPVSQGSEKGNQGVDAGLKLAETMPWLST